MSNNPAWRDRINKYLNDAFLLHESDWQVKQAVNKFTRWWLEQVRNLLAVSAFYFLAQKTGNLILELLAIFTVLLFLNYFSNWQNTFSFRFLPYIKNTRVNLWVNLALWLCVMMALWLLGIALIADVITAFGKLAGQ
jgi:hypothetical protein